MGKTDKEYLLIIKADTNDADYITTNIAVSLKVINRLIPIINKLKTGSHNWVTSHYKSSEDKEPYDMYVKSGLLSEKDMEYFNDLVPNGEYGIHTICSIEYYKIENFIRLF